MPYRFNSSAEASLDTWGVPDAEFVPAAWSSDAHSASADWRPQEPVSAEAGEGGFAPRAWAPEAGSQNGDGFVPQEYDFVTQEWDAGRAGEAEAQPAAAAATERRESGAAVQAGSGALLQPATVEAQPPVSRAWPQPEALQAVAPVMQRALPRVSGQQPPLAAPMRRQSEASYQQPQAYARRPSAAPPLPQEQPSTSAPAAEEAVSSTTVPAAPLADASASQPIGAAEMSASATPGAAVHVKPRHASFAAPGNVPQAPSRRPSAPQHIPGMQTQFGSHPATPRHASAALQPGARQQLLPARSMPASTGPQGQAWPSAQDAGQIHSGNRMSVRAGSLPHIPHLSGSEQHLGNREPRQEMERPAELACVSVRRIMASMASATAEAEPLTAAQASMQLPAAHASKPRSSMRQSVTYQRQELQQPDPPLPGFMLDSLPQHNTLVTDHQPNTYYEEPVQLGHGRHDNAAPRMSGQLQPPFLAAVDQADMNRLAADSVLATVPNLQKDGKVRVRYLSIKTLGMPNTSVPLSRSRPVLQLLCETPTHEHLTSLLHLLPRSDKIMDIRA